MKSPAEQGVSAWEFSVLRIHYCLEDDGWVPNPTVGYQQNRPFKGPFERMRYQKEFLR